MTDFLSNGGEMGELTRSFDWEKTNLGPQEFWPQSLRSIINTMPASGFPMFLYWGDDLIQFYNDAYRSILGNNGKHPMALGQKAEDCWIETWPIIKPLIDKVKIKGESVWSEN
jgi:two-component system sensor histidine kinase VicK